MSGSVPDAGTGSAIGLGGGGGMVAGGLVAGGFVAGGLVAGGDVGAGVGGVVAATVGAVVVIGGEVVGATVMAVVSTTVSTVVVGTVISAILEMDGTGVTAVAFCAEGEHELATPPTNISPHTGVAIFAHIGHRLGAFVGGAGSSGGENTPNYRPLRVPT